MNEKLQNVSANFKVHSRYIPFFLFFSTISVAALLTLDTPDRIGFNFMFLQVVARICVPMLLLMAAYDFFKQHEVRKDYLQESICMVRKGVVFYLVYAVIYLIMKYFVPFWAEGGRPSFNSYLYFLRGLVAGDPPCSWMILSFLVGIVLVSCLLSLRQRPLTILLIAFLFHTVSIFTEIYFNAIMKFHSVVQVWGMYTRFFVTTRNGLFFGFFWCALGYYLTVQRGVAHGKHMLFFWMLTVIAMIVEHTFAYSMGWARDFKSSFMMIPVCVYMFLSISDSTQFSGRFFDLQSIFNKQMFIAFMILPLIALGAKHMGVPAGGSLFILTLSVDLASSYVLAVFFAKINIKGLKLHG